MNSTVRLERNMRNAGRNDTESLTNYNHSEYGSLGRLNY